MALPLQYDEALDFSYKGFAMVEKEGNPGPIDAKGNVPLSCHYNDVLDFTNGPVPWFKNGKWGFINENGKLEIPFEYDFADFFASNGLVKVKKNGKWGYINAKNKVVIPLQYDEAWHFSPNGLAPVKKNGKYGYIDAKGKVVIPLQYDIAGFFASNGLAVARKDGKAGYIDAKNNVVIPFQYDRAREFDKTGLAWVQTEDTGFLIDEKGARRFSLEFTCGMTVVHNQEGQRVWPPNSRSAEELCDEETAKLQSGAE